MGFSPHSSPNPALAATRLWAGYGELVGENSISPGKPCEMHILPVNYLTLGMSHIYFDSQPKLQDIFLIIFVHKYRVHENWESCTQTGKQLYLMVV